MPNSNQLGAGSNYYSTGATSGYVSRTESGGFDSAVLVQDKRCLLLGITAYNNSGSTRTLQIFDSATVPSVGAVPKHILVIPTTGEASISFGTAEFSEMVNGLVVCSSSTVPTLTVSGTPDMFLQVFWLNQGY